MNPGDLSSLVSLDVPTNDICLLLEGLMPGDFKEYSNFLGCIKRKEKKLITIQNKYLSKPSNMQIWDQFTDIFFSLVMAKIKVIESVQHRSAYFNKTIS